MKELTSYFPTVRKLGRRRSKPGSRPGTIDASPELPAPTIRCIRFNPERLEESVVAVEELTQATTAAPDMITWIDVQGLGSADTLLTLGTALGLHLLTVEDIAHVHQRPKVEEHEAYLFVVLRCIRMHDEDTVDNEQISMVLKKDLLVTFQERPGDGFEPVRQRLREGKGTIRKRGADYIAYALIDTVIDLVFPVLEIYGDVMDRIDDEVLDNPQQQTSAAIHRLKRELRMLRRALWPLRDLAATLSRDDHDLIDDSVRVALRDCHDHAVAAADFVESAKERAADLGDRYLASISERTNQVMKVLTIVATIFIPLTYLAGLYGMNFDSEVSPFNMPELKWRYGYVAFWIVSLIIAGSMALYFRRRGWLGGDGKAEEDDSPDR